MNVLEVTQSKESLLHTKVTLSGFLVGDLYTHGVYLTPSAEVLTRDQAIVIHDSRKFFRILQSVQHSDSFSAYELDVDVEITGIIEPTGQPFSCQLTRIENVKIRYKDCLYDVSVDYDMNLDHFSSIYGTYTGMVQTRGVVTVAPSPFQAETPPVVEVNDLRSEHYGQWLTIAGFIYAGAQLDGYYPAMVSFIAQQSSPDWVLSESILIDHERFEQLASAYDVGGATGKVLHKFPGTVTGLFDAADSSLFKGSIKKISQVEMILRHPI